MCVLAARGWPFAWTHLDVQSGMSTHPHAKHVVRDRQIKRCEEKAGGLCARSTRLCCDILLWNSEGSEISKSKPSFSGSDEGIFVQDRG